MMQHFCAIFYWRLRLADLEMAKGMWGLLYEDRFELLGKWLEYVEVILSPYFFARSVL